MNEAYNRGIGILNQSILSMSAKDRNEVGVRVRQKVRTYRKTNDVLVGSIDRGAHGQRAEESGNLVAADDRVRTVQLHGLVPGDIEPVTIAEAGGGQGLRVQKNR